AQGGTRHPPLADPALHAGARRRDALLRLRRPEIPRVRVPMMTLLAIALCVQEGEPARSPFRAQMTIERFVKREDGATVQTGTLAVRPGDALLFDSRAARVLVRDGRATERRTGEKTARRWDLSKPENFQPLDLWRL